jgi:hypothetical protein
LIIIFQCIQTPLSIIGNQVETNLNLSTLLSITLFDENNNEIPVHTPGNNSIAFTISRDINFIIPPMFMQNVSLLPVNSLMNNRQFNLHFINITQSNPNMTVSIHFEMHSLNDTLGYMLIYKFDQIPQLNSSINYIDGWSILCPRSKKTNFVKCLV